jgi:hypothetical protein
MRLPLGPDNLNLRRVRLVDAVLLISSYVPGNYSACSLMCLNKHVVNNVRIALSDIAAII